MKEQVMKWKQGTFLVASFGGARPVRGLLYKGLALKQSIKGSPKGRRLPLWTLTHCGTGHAICRIIAHEHQALSVATEIAELGNWDFDGLEGWRNHFPDVRERLQLTAIKYPKIISIGGARSDHGGAMAVAMARA